MSTTPSTIRILFVGDIFGSTGKRVLSTLLPSLLIDHSIDFCIANGENAAGGNGLTSNLVKKFHKYGIHVITGGNHSFSIPDKDTEFMNNPNILRPLNYPPGNIGHGSTIFELQSGIKIGVINLLGRTFFNEIADCPFRSGKKAIETIREQTSIILVDVHAEASSEKISLAWYLDGLVSAVIGTHTHVQTADERILPGGTAYITDVGMTGPENSSIGMKPGPVINRFLHQTHIRFEPSNSGPMLNAAIIEIDISTGKAISINRIYERISFS